MEIPKFLAPATPLLLMMGVVACGEDGASRCDIGPESELHQWPPAPSSVIRDASDALGVPEYELMLAPFICHEGVRMGDEIKIDEMTCVVGGLTFRPPDNQDISDESNEGMAHCAVNYT